MIRTFILLFSFINLFGFTQQDTINFSYYFKNNSIKSNFEKSNVVPKQFYGKYELKPNKHNDIRIAAGDYFIIDSSGIYISKNNLISITKEEVRENGKYNVVNGYLFGVKQNDSVAVFLQDDRYFFLMPTKSYLYHNLSHTMYKVNSNSFIVFTKEDNGNFSILKIDFKGSSLKLSELELNYQQVKAIQNELIKENGYDTYLLNPKKDQWQLILNAFVMYDEYVKS